MKVSLSKLVNKDSDTHHPELSGESIIHPSIHLPSTSAYPWSGSRGCWVFTSRHLAGGRNISWAGRVLEIYRLQPACLWTGGDPSTQTHKTQAVSKPLRWCHACYKVWNPICSPEQLCLEVNVCIIIPNRLQAEHTVCCDLNQIHFTFESIRMVCFWPRAVQMHWVRTSQSIKC